MFKLILKVEFMVTHPILFKPVTAERKENISRFLMNLLKIMAVWKICLDLGDRCLSMNGQSIGT